jgi:flagellar assembly protein FliH
VLQAFAGIVPRNIAYSETELRHQADQILAEAEAKCQHLEQQAYEEGFRQGQKDGQEVGWRGLEEVIQRFETMLVALAQEKEKLLQLWERELVELAVTISQKIVGRELTIQPEAIREFLTAAFHSLREVERLRLLVHPQDYELLINHTQASWPPGLEVAVDGSLTPGGFLLETDQGEIDGTIETRWAKVRAAIDNALGNGHED